VAVVGCSGVGEDVDDGVVGSVFSCCAVNIVNEEMKGCRFL
jgi:hypothetical protein